MIKVECVAVKFILHPQLRQPRFPRMLPMPDANAHLASRFFDAENGWHRARDTFADPSYAAWRSEVIADHDPCHGLH